MFNKLFKTKEIKRIFEIYENTKQDLLDGRNQTDYNVGFYNGIELVVSILKNKNPVFLETTTIKTYETKEEHDETKRTKIHGVRRIEK